jgi:hypothetical protein
MYKGFVCFLCSAFLSLTGGLPTMAAEARERSLPVGEMISSGEVKFEARENVWKNVEPAHFPVFQGVRIKTENGRAFVVMTNNTQIEVGQTSLFSFQTHDQFQLFQGGASFRIPVGADMSFQVGNLSIGKPLPLEATKGHLISQRSDETVGSITLQANGAVTVKSIRGSLSIHDQHRAVLAALSHGESVTIPSVTASENQRIMVAQPAGYPTGEAATEEILGLSKTTWMFIGIGTVALVGGVIVWAASEDDDDRVFLLPPSP